MNIREQIGPGLNQLRAAKRKAYQKFLMQIWRPATAQEYVLVSNMLDESLNALEKNAREWVADAVDLAALKGPAAFALIDEALTAYLMDLREDIERKKFGSGVGTYRSAIDEDRFGEIHRRLERQVDSYRVAFQAIRSNQADHFEAGIGENRRGPKPADWQKAKDAIWGEIYRGDFKPKNQSEIEDALTDFLKDKLGKTREKSTARPYASDIWEEMQREDGI